MFYPSTCVGLRYGHLTFIAEKLFSAARLTHLWPESPLHAFASGADLPTPSLARSCRTGIHLPAELPRGVPPSLPSGGTGMLTGCPSPTLVSLG